MWVETVRHELLNTDSIACIFGGDKNGRHSVAAYTEHNGGYDLWRSDDLEVRSLLATEIASEIEWRKTQNRNSDAFSPIVSQNDIAAMAELINRKVAAKREK